MESLNKEHPDTYEVAESSEVEALIDQAEALKQQIDQARPLAPELWQTIQEKLKISWTYNSNAIEGNTLTLGETAFFLQQGLTSQGKPFKDYLEARNHAEAIDLLNDVVVGTRPITEGLIKEINALLLKDVPSTPAIDPLGRRVEKKATPGQYKERPNHVLQPDGTIHHYVEPLQVPGEMHVLVAWTNQHIDQLHPIVVGALSHYNYVRIHPFDDGNGRGARILMNLILLKKSYPPTVIRNEDRQAYIESIVEADRGDVKPFVAFIAQSVIDTEKMILEDLQTR